MLCDYYPKNLSIDYLLISPINTLYKLCSLYFRDYNVKALFQANSDKSEEFNRIDFSEFYLSGIRWFEFVVRGQLGLF